MGLVKGGKQWNMMSDFYKLYELYESGEWDDATLATKQFEFEKKWKKDLPIALELSEAISRDYLKNRRKTK